MKLNNITVTSIVLLLVVSMITGFFPVVLALCVGAFLGYFRPSIKLGEDKKDFLDNDNNI